MAYDPIGDLKESYHNLKRRILEISDTSCNNEKHLEALKDVWGKEICSVRQLEAADSLQSLIHLLEKRIALGWFKVDLLDNVLDEYEIEGATREDYLYYLGKLEEYRLKNSKVFNKLPYDPDTLREIPANGEALPNEISELICDEMGSEWRYFARELSEMGVLAQGKSDELDGDLTKTDREKIQILMDIFIEGDRRTKLSQLTRLLQNIKRHDLAEKVDDKFMELFRNSNVQ